MSFNSVMKLVILRTSIDSFVKDLSVPHIHTHHAARHTCDNLPDYFSGRPQWMKRMGKDIVLFEYKNTQVPTTGFNTQQTDL